MHVCSCSVLFYLKVLALFLKLKYKHKNLFSSLFRLMDYSSRTQEKNLRLTNPNVPKYRSSTPHHYISNQTLLNYRWENTLLLYMYSQTTPKSSPNPLIKNLIISTLPTENSHRRLKRKWCRDLLQR